VFPFVLFPSDLATLAQSHAQLPLAIEVLVDGPYGRNPYFSDSTETLILVAGGIGVTPMMALFSHLYSRAKAAATAAIAVGVDTIARDHWRTRALGTLRRIVLVWTVRTELELALFAEQIYQARQDNPFDAFDAILHVTGSDDVRLPVCASDLYAGMKPGVVHLVTGTARSGRPDLSSLLATTVAASGDRGDVVTAFVCGPESLVREVSSACFRYKCQFHSEEFSY
jgi:ferredoxin-NADP reductase